MSKIVVDLFLFTSSIALYVSQGKTWLKLNFSLDIVCLIFIMLGWFAYASTIEFMSSVIGHCGLHSAIPSDFVILIKYSLKTFATSSLFDIIFPFSFREISWS